MNYDLRQVIIFSAMIPVFLYFINTEGPVYDRTHYVSYLMIVVCFVVVLRHLVRYLKNRK